MNPAPLLPPPPVRACDADREGTLDVLRQHWMAGRLSLGEFEARCAEVCGACYVAELWAAVRELPVAAPLARPAAGASTSAVTSLVLGVVGAAGLLLSFGLLAVVTVPLTASAWAIGRHARRASGAAQGGVAAAAEAIGIVGTVVGCLALAACATLVASA